KIQRVPATVPCARRWKAKQALPRGLMEYWRRLDALTVEDVVRTPYTSHRPHRAFNDASLYSGHIRWKNHVTRHLPERCLRQYDLVQGIPHPVPETPAGGIDRCFQSHIISSVCEIMERSVVVQHPSRCEDGYLEWYHSVSHPRVIPPAGTSDVLGPSQTRVFAEPPPPPPPPAGDQDSRL
ncbi:unnamed protein product, partial [Vicia faba]